MDVVDADDHRILALGQGGLICPECTEHVCQAHIGTLGSCLACAQHCVECDYAAMDLVDQTCPNCGVQTPFGLAVAKRKIQDKEIA
jgi:uncharacterized protein (UPF0212 family)